MGRRSFARGLVFAAAAAAGACVAAPLLGPWLGGGRALVLYAVAVAALQPPVLAGRCGAPARAAALLTAGAGLAVAAAGGGAAALAVATAAALGAGRSGLLFRLPRGRALATEAALAAGSLALAALLAGSAPGPLGPALPIWGFLLVQSGYALVPGVEPRVAPRPAARGDAFERAARRLERLLEA